MATLEYDLTACSYRIRFRFGGRSFKRSLKTQDERDARAVVSRVEETIRLIDRGRIEIPPNADPAAFILSDGKLSDKPKLPEMVTLHKLFTLYRDGVPNGAKEANTRTTENLHCKHWERILGSHKAVQAITVADVQQYCDKRSRERGKRGRVRPPTIKKELATLRVIWNWGVRLGHLTGAAPIKGVMFAKAKEKLPFQTFDEIKRIIERGGLTPSEQKDLWDCLFLTGPEIAEVLEVVRATAPHPFLYPMFVFAAHTGARRSEMMRSRVEDFDFAGQTVLIREKKRNKSRETYRRVPMSPLLTQAMSDWFVKHPGGVYALCWEVNQILRQTFTTKCFRRCLKGSKWVRMRGFHVLRHSFASNLAAGGVDQRVIDEFMGHQTDEMRRRYRHLFPEQQRQAIQSVFGGEGRVGKD